MKHGQKSGILQLVPKSYGQAVRMASPGRKTSLIVRYDELQWPEVIQNYL